MGLTMWEGNSSWRFANILLAILLSDAVHTSTASVEPLVIQCILVRFVSENYAVLTSLTAIVLSFNVDLFLGRHSSLITSYMQIEHVRQIGCDSCMKQASIVKYTQFIQRIFPGIFLGNHRRSHQLNRSLWHQIQRRMRITDTVFPLVTTDTIYNDCFP